MSQRQAYEYINIIGKVSRKLLIYEGEQQTSNLLRNMIKRRRVSEALGLFFSTLDNNSTHSCIRLFNCSKFEVPLDISDKKMLGLTDTQAAELKRYRGLVIDGTSSGILGTIPRYERHNVSLTNADNTGDKFVITDRFQKKFFKLLVHHASQHDKCMCKDKENL